MLNLYFAWVDGLEANTTTAIDLVDLAHEHSLRARLATNEVFIRLWFPWL